MKQTIEATENCEAPHALGIRLPTRLPAKPPTYVGPLRTRALSAGANRSPAEAIPETMRRSRRLAGPGALCARAFSQMIVMDTTCVEPSLRLTLRSHVPAANPVSFALYTYWPLVEPALKWSPV